MKRILAAFVLLGLITILVAACGSGGVGGGSSNSTVHLSDTTFAQSSITINKGSSLTLVDDSSAPHIIANGSWMNGDPQPMQESGLPAVNNLQISGNGGSQTMGPFNAPGTFHLYCTIHPGMNLTVIVQ